MFSPLPFQRCLLKLSGEALSEKGSLGFSPKKIADLAQSLCRLAKEGLEIAIVIGGGNFFRGKALQELGVGRVVGDSMGMLATLINGLSLREAIEKCDQKAFLMSALVCPKIAESFDVKKAKERLAKKQVGIFVGGTGNPFFTTDTAAALRAAEIEAKILLKATKVDGIYDQDPFLCPGAVKYSHLTYEEMLGKNLKVIDSSAVSLCLQSEIPIFVFNMQLLHQPASLWMAKESYGTLVRKS